MKEITSVKDLVEEIARFEKNCPVNNYTISGHEIWPVVRYRIFLLFKHNLEKKVNQTLAPDEESNRTTNPVTWLINSLACRKSKSEYRRAMAGVKKEIGTARILLYSRNADHPDRANELRYNRLLDPFMPLLQKAGITEVVKFELGKSDQHDRACQAIQLETDALYRYFHLKKKPTIPERQTLVEFIEQTAAFLNLNVRANDVLYSFEKALEYKSFFTELLSKTHIRKVFLSGYYSPDTYGLIMACHELGIKTVDVQHGKQGRFHPMYSHWTVVPEKGYSLLPDFFWNWGDESVNNIGRWMPAHSPHKPVKGGNLWLSLWMNGTLGNEEPYRDFLDRIKTYSRVIMVSLQPIGRDIMPEHLINVIKNSDPETFWMIRLHPKMNPESHPELRMLSETNAHLDIENSTRLPLYTLLKYTTGHITCWSSVAYEALAFNVPTVIVHPVGFELFQQEMAEGVFAKGATEEELRAQLASFKIQTSGKYIETDQEISLAAVNEILQAN